MLPFATPVIGGGTQLVNPIHAGDLARVIIDLLHVPPQDDLVEIGGPETLAVSEMLAACRRWFGLPPTRQTSVAPGFARTIGRIGDALRLGPISATDAAEIDGAPLPPLALRYFRIWFALGWSAFAGLVAIYWLMVAKPVLWGA